MKSKEIKKRVQWRAGGGETQRKQCTAHEESEVGTEPRIDRHSLRLSLAWSDPSLVIGHVSLLRRSPRWYPTFFPPTAPISFLLFPPVHLTLISIGLLSDKAILEHMEKVVHLSFPPIGLYNQGSVVIAPFTREHLSTTSYDVTLGPYYYRETQPEAGHGTSFPSSCILSDLQGFITPTLKRMSQECGVISMKLNLSVNIRRE